MIGRLNQRKNGALFERVVEDDGTIRLIFSDGPLVRVLPGENQEWEIRLTVADWGKPRKRDSRDEKLVEIVRGMCRQFGVTEDWLVGDVVDCARQIRDQKLGFTADQVAAIALHESEARIPRSELKKWDFALESYYNEVGSRRHRLRRGFSKQDRRVAAVVEDLGVRGASDLVGINRVVEILEKGVVASCL